MGIPLVDPVPPGWKVRRRRRVGDHDFLVPASGKKGDGVRAEIAALPKQPNHHEVASEIGHPEQIKWKCEHGQGFSMMGRSWNPVFLGWAGETFIISGANADKFVAETRRHHPGCEILGGEWTPPSGLRQITKAESDLIYAQEKVKEEKEKAA